MRGYNRKDPDIYLQGIIDVENVKTRRPRTETPRKNSPVYQYHLMIGSERHKVCFLNAFGVTAKRVRRIRELKQSGKTPEDKRDIENLTHKTGNFKQFDIFATMLKSGLLKTSDSVILDLLTFDDLETLRSRRVAGRNFVPQASHLLPVNANNRRYLILTYTVEFDRIHYPLPLEYCGPPDPQILQGTIKRLEHEVTHLQEQLARTESNNRGEVIEQISALEKRLVEVTTENQDLSNENKILTQEVNRMKGLLMGKQSSWKQIDILHATVQTLEEKVKCERASLINLVKQLRQEKSHLALQLEETKKLVKFLRGRVHLVRETPHSNFFLKKTREVSPRTRSRNISPFNKNIQQPVQRKLAKGGISEAILGRNFNYISQNLRTNSSDSSIGSNERGRNRFGKHKNVIATTSRFRSSSGNSQKSGKNKHMPRCSNLLNNLQSGIGRSLSACSSASSNQSQNQNSKLRKGCTHKSRRELKTGLSDMEERVQTLQRIVRCGLSIT